MKKFIRSFSLMLALLTVCALFTSCTALIKNILPGDTEITDKGDGDGKEEGKDDGKEDGKDEGNKNPAVTEGPIGEKPDVPSHTHEWNDWEVTKDASCSEEGVRTYTCSCGQTKTEPIEKTEHYDYESVLITRPTATTLGKEVDICTECGQTVDERSVEISPKWTYYGDAFGYCSGYGYANGEYRDVILGNVGDVVYATEDGEEIEIYANGYFISKIGSVQYLKKYDGTIVCSTESLGVSGFGLSENYDEYVRFLADGYVFVYKTTSTVSKTEYEIGILGTDGQWIAPLSAEHPIITSGAKYSTKIFTTHSYEYAGEGILFVDADISDYYCDFLLYNIEENEVYPLVSSTYGSNLDYMATEASFVNGISCDFYSSTLYVFDKYGNVTVKSGAGSSKFESIIDADGNYYTLGSDAIYLNGSLHVSLDYTLTGASSLGDQWLVFIKNPEGKYFYSRLTTDGELAFEPVYTNATYVCDVSGVGVNYSSSGIQSDGRKIVIDAEGNVLFTSELTGSYIYVNNGVVCEEVKKAFSTDETFTVLGQ